MRYKADHDFHIHSIISPCCHDPNQTTEAIAEYARKNNYRKICLTNHLWDEDVESVAEWHDRQRFSYILTVLPLPESDDFTFCFGAETDMDYNYTVGVSAKHSEMLDFIVIPTTHLHLTGNTVKKKLETPEAAAEIWLKRLRELLRKELPWQKIGIAHLTCGHILRERTPEVIKLLDDNDLYSVFSDCALKKVGIELNVKTLSMSDEVKKIIFRPYFIAKDCGCKFYLGSDAHNAKSLETAKENFENVISILDLKESDKFDF